MGELIAGPGQGFQEVVEQAGAQGLVHPVAGQEHVVDLVHALDVPSAVPLLGLQACTWVWITERGGLSQLVTTKPIFVLYLWACFLFYFLNLLFFPHQNIQLVQEISAVTYILYFLKYLTLFANIFLMKIL